MKIALSLLFLMAMTEYSQQQDAETNDAKNGHDIQYQTNELHYACGSKGICRCNETRKGYLIDCSRRELHNLSLVIPSNVTLANFSINYLTLIPKDTFRLTTSLIMINISRNNISELYEETFHYTTQLKTLDINDNLFTQLPTNIFQKLVHLSVLRLSHNYIKELPEDIFNGNSNLNLLKLSFNRLRLLPEGLFTKTKSLIVLDLSFNNLTSLPKGLFDNTTSLKALFINNNNISYMPPDCFRKLEALGDLVLHENKLTVLSKTMFAENVRLRNLDLCDNNIARPTADFFPETKKLKLVSNSITHIPDGMFQYFKNLSQIYLSKNRIESLSNNAFLGLNCVYHLTLYGNNLSSLPAGLFKTTNLTFSLDLSNNSLSVIPRGLFSAYGRNHGMLILQLQRNNLTELRNDTFLGLGSLAYLILSRNRIHSIAERAFLGTHLKCIYLIANNISNVSNNSFALENIDIHLYKNNILNISQVALNGVGNESILYMNCNQLGKLPSSTNDNIICVNDESYPSLILNSTFQRLASSFEMQGFECKNIGKGKNECRPCPTGTHGGGFLKKCIECPKAFFFGCDTYKYHDCVCTSEFRIRCCNIYWSLRSRYFHHIYRLS
ncbi:uncharacterized protein [Apostichopus japonicus]|uniref:uncharacterized protein isoform X2 n=1 Tax=Stichopus japonicus TaxID=307972 RepID=UPI003AB842D7